MYQRTSRGTIITKQGVRITQKEHKEFKYLVDRANLKRRQTLTKYSDRRLREKSKLKDQTRGSDFLTAKKSQKLDRFETKAEFNKYVSKLRQISSGKYQVKQYRQYRQNLMSSLKVKFNSEGKELAGKLKQLTDNEIKDLTLGDKLHDIGWLYNEPINDNKKFNIINQQIDTLLAKRGSK